MKVHHRYLDGHRPFRRKAGALDAPVVVLPHARLGNRPGDDLVRWER